MYPNPGTQTPWKFVYIERDPAKWDTDVENIMEFHDPAVEKQLADLKKSQEDYVNSIKDVARNQE
jgi:hypothetical protein